MNLRGTPWRIGVAGFLAVTASCGADDDQSRAPGTSGPGTSDLSTTESTYCDDLADLTRLLDEGGTADGYNDLMNRIVDESPTDHATTWSLMLVLSDEPFSYDNFNPALDSLDRLGPDLEIVCPDLPQMVVDDSGRIRSWPTD